MKPFKLPARAALALLIAGMLASAPALADKPGKGKKQKHDDAEEHAKDRHFDERQRVVVRDYYDQQFERGRCPPGLAKKHNGCMPPGQAKKWQMGQPLAREVVYHPLPAPIAAQLGTPPPGYGYVRVASDILLIALGKGTVVDAINNLGRS
jgi:Ni/Co efflux regulator RcnB